MESGKLGVSGVDGRGYFVCVFPGFVRPLCVLRNFGADSSQAIETYLA